MTVKCESCPTLVYCLARLSDPTITGCGMPLYEAGLIKKIFRPDLKNEEGEG